MALTHYACTHCGGWILWFDTQQPLSCPNCTDVRNALPQQPFTYLPVTEAPAEYTTQWREVVPGLWDFWTEPQLGLGSHGWLIERPEGNIAFEAAPFYSQAARDQLAKLGGVRLLSASHPHGYGALWQLQEFFDPELIIHKDDLQHTKAFRVNHPIDDRYRVDDERQMLRLGGHYDGQTALYDGEHGILFLGDALKIDFAADGSCAALSCHKGYHYAIPLTRDELLHYRSVFTEFPFRRVCTPFEFGRDVDQALAVALVDHLLRTGIHTGPVPVQTLRQYV